MTSNWNPIFWIATLFFLGKIQHAGSIIATLLGLIAGVAIHHYWGISVLLVVTIVTFFVGLWSSSIYVKSAGQSYEVVIDEVVGIWVVLLLAGALNYPLDFGTCFAAFLFFVIFDMAKPWPVGQIDEHVGGGLGLMLDDVVAAFYGFLGMVVGLFFYTSLLA
ncbi:MAG: phosphatidylglycerophosphatase A [Rickettsiales bacterium]|nr:phosphatidylglycerophosphatase A [Rickettsiales bacterium]